MNIQDINKELDEIIKIVFCAGERSASSHYEHEVYCPANDLEFAKNNFYSLIKRVLESVVPERRGWKTDKKIDSGFDSCVDQIESNIKEVMK